MASSTASSLLSFCFYFAFIIHLLKFCCASEVRQQSSLDSEDSKSSVDYVEAFDAVIEEDDGKGVKDDRGKRALEIDEVSKKVIMLLVDKDKKINETYEHIKDHRTSTFKINDFIIRLQEKYEYTKCKGHNNVSF